MALRSVLRKLPAPGLRSPPLGPVRALSPAAGSRLISDGASIQINMLKAVMEALRREMALSAASQDEAMRCYRKRHQSLMNTFDKIDKASWALLITSAAAMGLQMGITLDLQ